MTKKKKMAFLAGAVAMGFIAYAGQCLNAATAERNKSDLTMENVEALSGGEGGSSNYNICYYETKVKVGYTCYDCGTCSKVYDEQGKGKYSKCFY